MKITAIMLLAVSALACQNPVDKTTTTSTANTAILYDSVAAVNFGADEYGMKKYVMAFLKTGPNRSQDSATKAQLQAAHMDNINRMANEGALVLAGPFFGDGALRGIYLFNVASIEEAKSLTNSDPAIQAGSLIMELHEWYGSAAIMAIDSIHKKIAKTNP